MEQQAPWLSISATRLGVLALVATALVPPLGLLVLGSDRLPLEGQNLHDASLRTSASSRLLFKNVRSVRYTMSEDAEAGTTRYSSPLENDKALPVVRWDVVDLWRQERAALVGNANAHLRALAPETVRCSSAKLHPASHRWSLDSPHATAATAAFLYRCLVAKGQAELKGSSGTVPLWSSAERARRDRRVFRDYFALIELL